MEEIIHIVPLGWERSRAITPIKKIKAHRIYLLYRTDYRISLKFVKKVKKELENDNIEIIEKQINPSREFDSLLFHISQIIMKENKKGNRIYLNLSSSGKIAAAAIILASTFHSNKITNVYYIQPEKYTIFEEDPKKAFNEFGFTYGLTDIKYIPSFSIMRPNDDAQKLLAILYEKGPQSYINLMKELKKVNVNLFKGYNYVEPNSPLERRKKQNEINKWVNKLKRNFIINLEKDNYIELQPTYKGPKKQVSITENGEYIAILSGLLKKLKDREV